MGEKPSPSRRYRIAEVSKLTEVPDYVLRQWEERFSDLKPRRDRANRRYYIEADIAVVRRIKQLLWHEGMTTEGANVVLKKELRGEGRPKTRHEAMDLIDKMQAEVRDMLELLSERGE